MKAEALGHHTQRTLSAPACRKVVTMCCQAAMYWAGVPANCAFLLPSISQNQRMRTGFPRAFVARARCLMRSS